MPKATVRVPTPLRTFVGGAPEVAVEADTVGAAVRQLTEAYPGLRRHLLTPDGKVRNFVSIYVNDTDVRALQRDATPVADGDIVSIVPAIAGGSPAEAGPRRVAAAGRAGPGPAAPFSADELRRYSRHLLLPEVGVGGQRALRRAKVLLVGTGGLGAPTALYLAAAGVGTLGLVDFDTVDLSNLQRQVLYGTDDVGRPKLAAARERLERLNPGTTVVPHEGHLDSSNALEILGGYDVVIDGTDNFPTRYLVNDASVLLGKPNVYGSIYRFEGQVSVFDARRGPCYRCLYPEPPPPDLVPSCAEAGVLGVLPGVVGALQATEAIKLLVGIGEPLIGRLLLYDASSMTFRQLRLEKNPDCVLCSPKATQHGLIDYPAFCGVATAPAGHGIPEVTPEALRDELAGPDPPLLVDVREPAELEISHLEGAVPIPKAELPERVDELTHARSVVVFCRSGARSADAVRMLLELGFQNVRNLRGGINGWAQKIDPGLPTY
ncbi:MAG TPA: molybdopterin-synthase adenylyltransferase MoeB [Thermoplasmata archaeon]|nr:molybdopterin-synthase adenylyltransferase MoeB [Thermoplasmata archaeon]